MKKFISLMALILTLAGTLPAQDQAPVTRQYPTNYYVPSDPAPAAAVGADYGTDGVYLLAGAAVVAGAIALIVTSSHGDHHGHAHVHG